MDAVETILKSQSRELVYNNLRCLLLRRGKRQWWAASVYGKRVAAALKNPSKTSVKKVTREKCSLNLHDPISIHTSEEVRAPTKPTSTKKTTFSQKDAIGDMFMKIHIKEERNFLLEKQLLVY